MDMTHPASVEDVHEIALGMPFVTVEHGSGDNPVYQVGGKSFIFFRTPRPDAVDPETGVRYPDVIVFWVPSDEDKLALVQDETNPFFTTPHFNGHRSVLVRASRLELVTSANAPLPRFLNSGNVSPCSAVVAMSGNPSLSKSRKSAPMLETALP